MSVIPSIDLHPDALPGKGPEGALMALRAFLENALRAGHREVRIITGVGTRGDGTPRLRHRVETEVLSGFALKIESQAYEQNGAVIRLRLKTTVQRPSAAYLRAKVLEDDQVRIVKREERYELCWQRLDMAKEYLDENNLRKARLKLNQVARELGCLEIKGPPARQLLLLMSQQLESVLKALD